MIGLMFRDLFSWVRPRCAAVVSSNVSSVFTIVSVYMNGLRYAISIGVAIAQAILCT